MERRLPLLERWPTGAILLLLLSAALLPLGLVLAWAAQTGVREAREAVVVKADQQGLLAAQAIESLIARNVLALRIAANAGLAANPTNPCPAALRSLSVSPAVAQHFRIRRPDGTVLCAVGDFAAEHEELLVE